MYYKLDQEQNQNVFLKMFFQCRPREDGLGVSVTLTRAEEEQLPNARAYTMQVTIKTDWGLEQMYS